MQIYKSIMSRTKRLKYNEKLLADDKQLGNVISICYNDNFGFQKESMKLPNKLLKGNGLK